MRSVTISPLAEADLVEIVEYYALEGGRPLADEFKEAFVEGIHFICENPDAPPILNGYGLLKVQVRSTALRKFTMHRIYFTDDGSAVSVVRILHSSRNVQRVIRDTFRRESR